MKFRCNSVSAFALLSTMYSPKLVMTTNPSGTNHKVTVGKDGPGFVPPQVSAKKGDSITFVFYKAGHTLTQTRFENPCAGMNPSTASICTTSKSDSSGYPTGSTNYPTVGSGSPITAPYPTDGVKDPSSTNSSTSYPTEGVKDPSGSTSTNSYPTTGSNPPPNLTDPTHVDVPSSPPINSDLPPNPQCICPPVTQSSPYPTGPDPTPPKEKTCDGKCIEVAGKCQISTDCQAQSQSPSDSKCKMENGQCKKCGQSARKMIKKRDYEGTRWGLFTKNLFRRQSADDTAVNNSKQVDTTELQTAPLSQQSSAESSQISDPASQPSPSSVELSASTPTAGLDSGFVKVSGSEKTTGNSWTIQITADDKPLWFMCATPKHCTSGMVFAVNAPATGDNTFDKFLQSATSSTCPTPYPSQVNLQGDGCSASAPPCGGDKKNETSTAPPPDKPAITDPSQTPNNPDTNSTTPAQNPTPPSSPSPPSDPKPPTPDDKPPTSEGSPSFEKQISLISIIVIFLGSFIISEFSI